MADHGVLPRVGESLGQLTVVVTQETVRRYAEASGDYNPIHLDPGFAATTPFGVTIAHGMLLLAYVSRLMSARFGRTWAATGNLEARFRAPARVGATIVAAGAVESVTASAEGQVVVCSLTVADASGQALVTASARVVVASVS
jgi:3-hydroxybutyryl-CoA dehydratase